MLPSISKTLFRRFSFVKKMSESVMANSQRVKRVQQNVLQQSYRLQPQMKLRQKADFDDPMQDLQQQLTGQIARSLRKSQDNVKYFIQKTQAVYQQLISSQQKEKTQHEIQKYNQMVGLCEKAKWEYMIHRQSCGLILNNHELVDRWYQVPPRITI